MFFPFLLGRKIKARALAGTEKPRREARLFPFSILSSEYQVGGVSLPDLLG
jgi:hypothetical protein